jgi:hypothetical protein
MNLKCLHDLFSRDTVTHKKVYGSIPSTEYCEMDFGRVQLAKALFQLATLLHER